MDDDLFEIKDGVLVSFKGKDEDIYDLEIPAEVTCIGEKALFGSMFAHVTFLGNVTSIEKWAFAGCEELRTIDIPSGVKTIEPYAFASCSELYRVSIPEGVEKICEFAFSHNQMLYEIKIPASVTHIDPTAFLITQRLSEINVDEKNEAYMSIDGNLYTRDGKTLVCANTIAKGIDIPESVTAIGDHAFECKDIAYVKLPAGVSSIGAYAFSDCSWLEAVEMPAGIKKIGDNAFDDCHSLKFVYYAGTAREWTAISVGRENSSLSNAAVYFYSEVEPSGGEKCWRYVDGKPVEW